MDGIVALDFPKLFTSLIANNLSQLLEELPPRPPRRGRPAGFNETELQDFLNHLSEEDALEVDDVCPPVIINRVLPGADRTRPDYSFVRCVPPITAEDVLATCEVKGPVMKAFFDIQTIKRRWGRRVTADVEGQLERTTLFPHAQHFVALLVPFRVEWTKDAPLDAVLRCIQHQVPPAVLKECFSASVMLPNDVPL